MKEYLNYMLEVVEYLIKNGCKDDK